MKTLLAAVALALTAAAPVAAATVDFNFVGSTGISVSGTFHDIGEDNRATSFSMTVGSVSFSDVDASSLSWNEFIFDAERQERIGGLFIFDAFTAGNITADDGYVSLLRVEMGNDGHTGVSLYHPSTGYVYPNGGATFVVTSPPPVPLPAGGLLLLSGIAGVAALKSRKRRSA